MKYIYGVSSPQLIVLLKAADSWSSGGGTCAEYNSGGQRLDLPTADYSLSWYKWSQQLKESEI